MLQLIETIETTKSVVSDCVLLSESVAECLICGENGTENLKQLACSHTLCYDCMKQTIKVGRPTAKITYNHLLCPLRCKSSLCVVPEIQSLVLQDAALMRTTIFSALEKYSDEGVLQYTQDMMKVTASFTVDKMLNLVDEKDIDHLIENPFDIVDEALKTFDYFECFVCQLPFFGGKHNCIAAMPEDTPKEKIICANCSSFGKTDCTVHGKEYIIWKCMFCCSTKPVTFLCGGVDNYCDRCHERPGTCYPCIPSDCVFHGTHPAAAGVSGTKGPRYALGCLVCKEVGQEQMCTDIFKIEQENAIKQKAIDLAAELARLKQEARAVAAVRHAEDAFMMEGLAALFVVEDFNKILVSNLKKSTDRQEILDHFAAFGNVAEFEILRKKNGKLSGQAVVTYLVPADAVRALAAAEHEVDGKVISVRKWYLVEP